MLTNSSEQIWICCAYMIGSQTALAWLQAGINQDEHELHDMSTLTVLQRAWHERIADRLKISDTKKNCFLVDVLKKGSFES